MRMGVLQVRALLQPRIVLLECVSIFRVIQEKCEIRIEVEQRAPDKSVDLQCVSVRKRLAVVGRKSAQLHLAAISRVDVAETVKQARIYQVERNLTGRVEVIPTEDEPEPEFLVVVQCPRVVCIDIVATIATGADKRAVGVRSIVSNIRIYL